MPCVIVNSSPLISLGKIGQLNILNHLYGDIVIPNAVWAEIMTDKESKEAIELQSSLSWIRIVDIKNVQAKKLFKSQLHDGEVEVIILGKELGADILIIDDKLARNHAKYLGFNVTDTLGLLVAAKTKGIVSEIKPLIDKMVEAGIYVGEDLIKHCLKKADEI